MAVPALLAAGGGAGLMGSAGGGASAGGAAAGAGGLWAWLEKLLSMGGGGAAPTQATGMVGNAVPQTGGSYIGQVQRMQANPNLQDRSSLYSSGQLTPGGGQFTGQGGGGGGGGSLGQKKALETWQNLSDKLNGIAFGLQAFGRSLGGEQKEGLNMIPRNPIPIVHASQLVNPGTQNLQSILAAIMAGR